MKRADFLKLAALAPAMRLLDLLPGEEGIEDLPAGHEFDHERYVRWTVATDSRCHHVLEDLQDAMTRVHAQSGLPPQHIIISNPMRQAILDRLHDESFVRKCMEVQYRRQIDYISGVAVI